MVLKRIVLLAALLTVLANSTLWAQETGPLVMRAEFEWTVVGTVAGAALGVLLWLTDPGNPGNKFSDTVAVSAAWGTILGAGFGVFVLQRSAIAPANAVRYDPLNPLNRISADPVGEQAGQGVLMAHRPPVEFTGPALRLPVLSLHF